MTVGSGGVVGFAYTTDTTVTGVVADGGVGGSGVVSREDGGVANPSDLYLRTVAEKGSNPEDLYLRTIEEKV